MAINPNIAEFVATLVACAPSRLALGSTPQVEKAAGSFFQAAQAAWPGIQVNEGEFAKFLAARVPEGEDFLSALASMAGADLYLACACTLGDTAALKEFKGQVLSAAVPAILSVRKSSAFVDEVEQLLAEKLFVKGGDGRAKIGDYAGRGSLVSWVRAAAVRTALNLRRGDDPAIADQDRLAQAPSAHESPELKLIRARHGEDFRRAFADAFAALSVQERNLIRLSLLDGLSIDQIGLMYRVHRATAARWIARAQTDLQENVQRLLRERLKLAENEFESLFGALRSQIDVNLSQWLRTR